MCSPIGKRPGRARPLANRPMSYGNTIAPVDRRIPMQNGRTARTLRLARASLPPPTPLPELGGGSLDRRPTVKPNSQGSKFRKRRPPAINAPSVKKGAGTRQQGIVKQRTSLFSDTRQPPRPRNKKQHGGGRTVWGFFLGAAQRTTPRWR